MKDNKFLALYCKKGDQWFFDLPGGRMEFGETAEETLVREINEELGLQVSPTKLIDTWNYVEGDYQVTGLLYLCMIDNDVINLSGEHDKYEWVPYEEATKLVDHRTFLDKVHPWNKLFVKRMMYWDWKNILDSTAPMTLMAKL